MAKQPKNPMTNDERIAAAMKSGDVLKPGGVTHPKEQRGEAPPAMTSHAPEFGGPGVQGVKDAAPAAKTGGVTGHDLARQSGFSRPAPSRGITGDGLSAPAEQPKPKPSKGVSGHAVLGLQEPGDKKEEK